MDKLSLQWRHNGRDGVSNHQPHDCLPNRLVGPRSKNTSKLRVTGLCAGNSPGTGEFPAQMASNAEMFPFDDVNMYIGCLMWDINTHPLHWRIYALNDLNELKISHYPFQELRPFVIASQDFEAIGILWYPISLLVTLITHFTALCIDAQNSALFMEYDLQPIIDTKFKVEHISGLEIT